MPFFDMKCNQCETVTEMLLSFEESEAIHICTKELQEGLFCAGELTKQVSAPGGFEFHGQGCYQTEKHRR